MKRYGMKRTASYACLAGIFLTAALPAAGQVRLFGQDYGFSLSAGPGVMYGTSYEIVYRSSGSDDYLSELQWEIKPLYYLGLELELAPARPLERRGFFAALGVKAALPMKTGTMEDRDWLQPGTLNLFSSHDNHTTAAVMANIDAGFSLPIWKILIRFGLGLDYRYFRWEARDGYTQYGANDPGNSSTWTPWDPNLPKVSFSGLGITYQQHWILVSLGAGADFFWGRFTLSPALFGGPAFCIDIDDHHVQTPPFRTIGYLAGFWIKPELSASFSFTPRWSLSLSASYLSTGETRGHMKENEAGKISVYNDAAGARLGVFEGGVTVTYRF